MFNPIQQKEAEQEIYVSPTSDETLQKRYQRIQQEESALTEAEIQEKIAQLEVSSDLLDWEGNE